MSRDKSEPEFQSYYQGEHADYLAVRFGTHAIGQLASAFNISGIPALILTDNKTGLDSGYDNNKLRTQISDGNGWPMAKAWNNIVKVWAAACGADARLPYGREVLVDFLKAREDLNGEFGNVVGYTRDRLIVDVDNQDVALKRANLFPTGVKCAQGKLVSTDHTREAYKLASGEVLKRVETRFLKDTPVFVDGLSVEKWNGKCGVILEYLEDVQRYMVAMNSRETLKIKPQNIFL